MQLFDRGRSFQLKIVGYQYPGINTGDYDSNWLVIRVHIDTPERSWAATDPCLLTYEVEELAIWLESIRQSQPPVLVKSFIEPGLVFRLIHNTMNEQVLRVHIAYELRPDWPTGTAMSDDLWIEFRLSHIDVHAAAVNLREQLRQYPPRSKE